MLPILCAGDMKKRRGLVCLKDGLRTDDLCCVVLFSVLREAAL